jgi:hypothetical protein
VRRRWTFEGDPALLYAGLAEEPAEGEELEASEMLGVALLV